MKIGISVKINVTKIDKAKLYQGNKGTYLDMTTFIDTEEVDQYDNNRFISQSVTKEEREKVEKGRILGNCKLFFKEGSDSSTQPSSPSTASQAGFDDDIPF